MAKKPHINAEMRPYIDDLMKRLDISETTAYVYYYRCKKYDLDPYTYDGHQIEKRQPKLPTVKLTDANGESKKFRTELTLDEQKAILVQMILNSSVKDTDRLKAIDMYNEIVGNKESNINGKLCLEIKDWTEKKDI